MDYLVNDRIIEIIEKRKLSKRQVALAIGISPGNITDWGNHKNKPSINAITKLSDYLGISCDMILKGYENQYTEQEHKIIENLRKLDEIKRGKILERIECYLEELPKEENLSPLKIG